MAGKYGKRFSKRRKLYRRYGKRKSLGGKVRSIARKVRGLRKAIETKYIDLSPGVQTTVAATSNTPWVSAQTNNPFFYLPMIAEGDDISNRDGKEIKITSMDIKLLFNMLDNDVCEQFRVILFRDKFFDGNSANQPTPAKLLENTSTLPAALISPLNWTNRRRFRVIKDKTFFMTRLQGSDPGTPGGLQPHDKKLIKWHIKCNKTVRFSGTDNTAASGGQGAYYLLILSPSTAQLSSVYPTWRVKFQG